VPTPDAPPPFVDAGWQPETRGLWPSAAHAWLLHAALRPRAEALAALERWKEASGYDDYADQDAHTMRVLARAGRRLDRDLPADAWTGRMRGLCRYVWMRDAVRLRDVAPALRALHGAGIPLVLLKGEALVTGGILPRDGRRVMSDTDVLVRTEDFPKVHAALAPVGWRCAGPTRLGAEKRHALTWTGPAGFELDVHRFLLPVPFETVGLEEIRAGARAATLAGIPVEVPDTTHLLLHACVNGRKYDGRGPVPFEWVADAWDLLHHEADPVDWALLLERAVRYDVLLPVRDTLGYMRAAFGAPVPEPWLARARALPLRGAGIRAFAAHAGRPAALPTPRRLWLDMRDAYRARARNLGVAPTALGWSAYLASRAARRGPRHLGRALRRVVREGTGAFRATLVLDEAARRRANRT